MTLTIYWRKKPFEVLTVTSISSVDYTGFVSVGLPGKETPVVFALCETFGISIAP